MDQSVKDAAVELQCRCADAVDRRDWIAFGRCFADGATTDLPRTGVNADARQMLMSVQEIVGRLDVTQHHLSNHMVSGTGPDAIVATCYVLAQHVRTDAEGRAVLYTFGGRYTDTLTHKHGELRIAHRQLEILWTKGDATILLA
jgi:hypothetical protein